MDEAARQGGLGRRTLTRWVSEGKLRAYYAPGDRKRYVDMDEIAKARERRPVQLTRDQLKVRLVRLVENLEAGRTTDPIGDRAELKEVVSSLEAFGMDTFDRGTASQIKRAKALLSR